MKFLFLLLLVGISSSALSQETQEAQGSFLPSLVAIDDFQALKGQSPFLRSLNLSDSLILTGIATVADEQVATLLNKDTKETFVVSSQLNSQGWKMVELKVDKDLEKVAAKVAVDGGEVVTVRYAEWQLKPGESKPGAGPSTEPAGGPSSLSISIRPGGEGDGRRGEGDGRRFDGRRGPPGGSGGPGGGPSPEFRERMSQLSEDQRQQMFQKMSELREKQPDMSWEERGKMMSEMMNKMSPGQ